MAFLEGTEQQLQKALARLEDVKVINPDLSRQFQIWTRTSSTLVTFSQSSRYCFSFLDSAHVDSASTACATVANPPRQRINADRKRRCCQPVDSYAVARIADKRTTSTNKSATTEVPKQARLSSTHRRLPVHDEVDAFFPPTKKASPGCGAG